MLGPTKRLILKSENTGGQVPFGRDVILKNATPAFSSAALGVYKILLEFLFGEKTPCPLTQLPGTPVADIEIGNSLLHALKSGPAESKGT